MIKKMKVLSVAAFVTVAVTALSHVASAAGATTVTPTTTNILQSISVQFTIYSQGGLVTNKQTKAVTSSVVTSTIDTKQFIALLGTNIATTKTISSAAMLALDTVVTSTSTNTSIVVVDGTNIYAVASSVIPNFNIDGSPIVDGVYASGTLVGVTTEIVAATQSIAIPGKLNLSLAGTVTITVTGETLGKGKTASFIPLYNSDLTLSGWGTEGTSPVVVSGKVTESFLKVLLTP